MTSWPLFSTIRLLSIAIVTIAAMTMPAPLFKALFTAALFGHYALSFYYAKNQAKRLTTLRSTWIPLGILSLATLAYVMSGAYVWFLAGFIGLHIALSEVYMVNLGQEPPATVRWHLNLARYVTNVFLYLLLLNRLPLFEAIPTAVSFVGIAAGFTYFIVTLQKYKSALSPESLRDFSFFEISGIAVALVLFASHVPMSPQLFVYYHVTTWILYPATSFHLRGDRKAMTRFLLQTVAVTAFFFVLSTPLLFEHPVIDLVSAIPLWATLHFTSSFPLSRLNPVFIVRHFYPS